MIIACLMLVLHIHRSFMRQISVKQGAQSTVGGERQVKVEVVGLRLS